jgi:hypothetical protein
MIIRHSDQKLIIFNKVLIINKIQSFKMFETRFKISERLI